jgi:putative ABC transport system ATP-binding protein
MSTNSLSRRRVAPLPFAATLERERVIPPVTTPAPAWEVLRTEQPRPTNGGPVQPILEARDVTKVYALGKTSVEALKGVTMSVAPGEFVALMGPSGSGKSTLLQLLGGLDRPSTGSIVFEGRDISHLSDSQATKLRRERTGYIFQAFNLIPLLNVSENVALPFTIAGGPRDHKERVRQVVDLVELTGKERHRPDQLSAGEQQRVAVARALVTRPSVLLADEPTGNLDYTNSGELLDALWRSCEHGGQTIVLVTHDARAAAYADRVLVIGDGQIQEEITLGRRADHSAAPLIARLAQVGL